MLVEITCMYVVYTINKTENHERLITEGLQVSFYQIILQNKAKNYPLTGQSKGYGTRVTVKARRPLVYQKVGKNAGKIKMF